MPKVSVIVPNYNHENFLKERLDSIFNQTFQDYEVILLDDASTDKSVEVLDFYKDYSKVSHFIVNENNSGSPFKQWIKGISLAKGEYIWIAESDDFADDSFLQATLDFASKKEELGLVFVTSKVIDETGLLQDNVFKPPFKNTGFSIATKDEISLYLVKNLCILNASSVLFKADVLKSIDLLRLAKFKNSGDRYTYIQIALKSKIYFLDKKLNYYRSHSLNITKKNIINYNIFYDRLMIIEDLIPHFCKYKVASRNLKDFYFQQIFRCSETKFIKRTRLINYSMLKNGLMDFRTYLEMVFLGYIIAIFNGEIPYRIRKYYKNKMKEKYLNN